MLWIHDAVPVMMMVVVVMVGMMIVSRVSRGLLSLTRMLRVTSCSPIYDQNDTTWAKTLSQTLDRKLDVLHVVKSHR